MKNPDSQITRTYDSGDRITSETTSSYPNLSPKTINYTYDLNNNRLTMAAPQGGITTYNYDALNRATSIDTHYSQTLSFSYDQLGRVTSKNINNEATTSFNYQGLNQLAGITNKSSTGAIVSQYHYAYNKKGNRISQTELEGNRIFAYDPLNQLITTETTTPLTVNETFTYDGLGNRLTKNGILFPSVETLEQPKKIVYNAEDQLERVEILNAEGTVQSSSAYKYDALGRRIQKNVDGIITCYIYDFDNILSEYDINNNITANYIHGLTIDNPLIMRRDINSDQIFENLFYHTDGLGSITELTGVNGTVAQKYKYDSFGSIVDQIGNIDNPYTFTGREIDTESDFYYYRARYYDSNNGRFLSPDPIGFLDGLNLYIYVQNNPINLVDPSGLLAKGSPNRPKPPCDDSCLGDVVNCVLKSVATNAPDVEACLVACARAIASKSPLAGAACASCGIGAGLHVFDCFEMNCF